MLIESDDGTRLWVRVREGRGPTLLFAHSVGCDAGLWEPLIDRLPADWRLIAYDSRGHGRSDAPAGDYTVAQLGRDAIAVLDAVGADRAIVCGLSLGGTVAQWLAFRAPDRLQGIVLADTAARLGTVEGWQARIDAALGAGMASLVDMSMSRFFSSRFAAGHPEVVAQFRAVFLATPPHGFAGACAVLRDADTRAELAAIAVATLVICGRDDVPTPPADSATLMEGIPGAEQVLLDAGHLSAVEDPEGFAAALVGFVGRLQS